MFDVLEVYFANQKNDTKVLDHIFIVYQVAKEDKSLEAYEILLKRIYASTINFSAFVVEKISKAPNYENDKRSFKVKFPINRFKKEDSPEEEQEGYMIKTDGEKMKRGIPIFYRFQLDL